MGLFDLFKSKKKQPPAAAPEERSEADSFENFHSFYLYGFTNNPWRQSTDIKAWGELYQRVIGIRGGILPGGSFHPYQLINAKGATAWQAAYLQLYVSEKRGEAFRAIIVSDALVRVDVSPMYNEAVMWPDTRLSHEENPVFSKYVPFVIPFLAYKKDQPIIWDEKIQSEMAAKGHASAYVEQITKLSIFLTPPPSFIVGFDEFDEANPSKLIDNFISCKKLFGIN
jgi:hypothetical protein